MVNQNVEIMRLRVITIELNKQTEITFTAQREDYNNGSE